MKNAKQIWQETAKQLEKVYDQRESENISYLLLEDLFQLKRADILGEREWLIDERKLSVSIARLLNHEPIQYVTGIADFFGYQFFIQKGALIPRPETEELVALIIKENSVANPRILDVGSGSGCIPIVLKLKLGGEVSGLDISEEALQVSRKNAEKLGASVSFSQLDVLKMPLPCNQLDVLVSNPPYIPNKDRQQMAANVLDYEPEMALFVSNEDPFIFYRRIAQLGLNSLKSGGKLYFEIHERFGSEIVNLLSGIGYSHVHLFQDMQGKDRMVSATNSTNK